ncbi:MAG: dicarboxylate/amino acid:cation symporter [Pirellulales bacterium]|nr:dicarboxylate/amino acid:cation symporter [Pirellulales bacterium]
MSDSSTDSSFTTGGEPRGAADDANHTRRGWPLHTKIVVGLLLGALVGLAANVLYSRAQVPVFGHYLVPTFDANVDTDANGVDDRLDWAAINVADPLGRIFLRLVLMVVVPLVFSALSLGVLELGDVRRLGRIGVRTLVLTLVLSFSAVAIGITLVNVIQPGTGLSAEKRQALEKQYAPAVGKAVERAGQAKSLKDTLLDIIPENPLQEAVGALDGSSPGNGMLAVMFFALVFGVALSVAGPRTTTLVSCLEGLFDVTMVVIGFAMRLAPYAVACLVFAVTARMGLDIVKTLFWFVLTVLLGLGIHLFVVYSAVVYFVGGRRPWDFLRDTSEAIFTAFGTSSSNATLPTSLRVARDRLKLPPDIAQFVLTVGSTGNQNGTALYEGVVVLFLAQVFGKDLTLAQQISVVLMSVLAGVGTAGVPGGSLPLLVIVLRSTGVPAEGIGIILGVDRLLDMSRTVLNVTGDLAIAACVASKEAQPSDYPERGG